MANQSTVLFESKAEELEKIELEVDTRRCKPFLCCYLF